MINLNNLENWIIKHIDLYASNPSIIYIGGGTYCSSVNDSSDKYWKYEENQQFPPFLHDFKSSNIDIKILVVLIDPAFDSNTAPYIVNSQDQYYSNSWTKSNEYSNLYHSTLDIDVIVIPDKIVWKEKFQKVSETFNFTNFMVNLTNKVIKSNCLLFYHEFTGSNPIMLEQIVKKKVVDYNSNKICIDITRSSDMSCYFNLSNPEFYPVILLDRTNNMIKYINPEDLTNNEKNKIISEYKKFTEGFEVPDSKCEYYKHKTNYLFATNPDIILCFQIIKYDKLIFNIISNGLIPMIRYLYICEDYSNINNKMWGMAHLMNLNSIIYSNYIDETFISNKTEQIQKDLNFIESINSNISLNPYLKEKISYLKENIISGLFDIIKNILINIVSKYQINVIVIEDFITNLKQLENKYNMIQFYKNFIILYLNI